MEDVRYLRVFTGKAYTLLARAHDLALQEIAAGLGPTHGPQPLV